MVLDMKLELPLITFVSIATGRYLAFWENQFNSAKHYLDKSARIEFVILTDQIEELKNASKELLRGTNWKLQIGHVPHQEWPFPTLYKFKHIISNWNLLNGEAIWHLDADMVFSDRDVHISLLKLSQENEMVFVSHPGYFRSKGASKLCLYLNWPPLLLKDLKCLIKERGLGTWEKNRLSLAFVESHKRLNYVCGGSWGGKRQAFLEFLNELSNRVNSDLYSGVMARYHDESHINWFRVNYRCKVLDPSYCYEESYPHLNGLQKKIIAVDKSEFSNWER